MYWTWESSLAAYFVWLHLSPPIANTMQPYTHKKLYELCHLIKRLLLNNVKKHFHATYIQFELLKKSSEKKFLSLFFSCLKINFGWQVWRQCFLYFEFTFHLAPNSLKISGITTAVAVRLTSKNGVGRHSNGFQATITYFASLLLKVAKGYLQQYPTFWPHRPTHS